ncbi:hypothetical protein J4218_06655 [Candidatus Pacearchaeota archaeon]|nr:hypothetical protein [Candidatus Pacearchaeota archaeon]
MSLADYVKHWEKKSIEGHIGYEEARARTILAERILKNIQNTNAGSDEELRARNRYENGMGHVWLEENDWVYGMLTKTIQYARQNMKSDIANKVYVGVHVLQKKIRMRKMSKKEYVRLEGKSVEDLAKYLKRNR